MAGRAREGWDMLTGALAVLDESQDRFFDAEMCRVKGELLRALPPVDAEQVEARFQEALALASSQAALGLELRAASSLCRLYRAQGRADEGRRRLAEVFARFHDGFESPDLVAARALLDATV
jgi:predicted ATPase